MAETTKFVLEGAMTLAFISSEHDSKHVFIEKGSKSDCFSPGSCAPESTGRQRLETRIADELDFPSEEEYDEIFGRISELREKNMRPIEGEPDGTREVNLRITVEVLP